MIPIGSFRFIPNSGAHSGVEGSGDTFNARPPLSYGPNDAARVASVGRSTIFEEIKVGRLKARKAGRRTLILHEDLAAWLASLPYRASIAA
ncbi:helix-turn-helix domain-containing protein [uncultured Methylobacterium sp.]|uniref:helix-turn-helix domain-containing protein n=1 Tax=uncultured Methylobacterium sp. TaxID=157278 RepID=UPI0035CAD355